MARADFAHRCVGRLIGGLVEYAPEPLSPGGAAAIQRDALVEYFERKRFDRYAGATGADGFGDQVGELRIEFIERLVVRGTGRDGPSRRR